VRRLFNISIICLAVLVFSGCRARRGLNSTRDKLPEKKEKNLITVLDPDASNFTTMKSRKANLKIGLEGIQNQATGNLAVYRDSIIALSVIPILGFEAFRVLCNTDSIIVINRIEKSYYAASFEEAGRKYNIPVGFQDLQAILFNEVFYYKDEYEDREYKDQFNEVPGGNLYLIEASCREKRLTRQGIKIDSIIGNITNMFIIDYERRIQLDISYDEFEETGSFQFPKKLAMKIAEPHKTIKLEINYGQTVFNDPIHIEFKIPVNYRREEL
jgi:hypothetical protein